MKYSIYVGINGETEDEQNNGNEIQIHHESYKLVHKQSYVL